MIIDKLGRKSMLIIGNITIILGLILILLVTYYPFSQYFALFSIVWFIVGFSLAAGPILSIYLSDILPDVGIAFSMGS